MKKLFKQASTLLALSTVLATSLTACGTNNRLSQELALSNVDQVNSFASRPRVAGQKKWTIAIHMAADNNLYSAGLDDINEMEAGLKSDDVNVLVLFDGAQKGDSKIYKIKTDKSYDKNIISEVVDDKGLIIPPSKEIDSGDAKVFNKFVDFVTKNYPADNNFVAIWNHGDGIFRNSTKAGSFMDSVIRQRGATNKSFASDDSGTEMHLRDLNPALAIAKQNLGKNLSILGFDTCLMGYLETAYQVSGQADYLVASEELEPGDGWDYDGFLKAVSANPSMSPAELSSALVDTYGKSYANGTQSGRNVTLSATDINALTTGLVPALNGLAKELTANVASLKPSLTSVRSQTQTFYNRDSADLGDFLKKLNKGVRLNDSVRQAAQKVQTELSKAVIKETHSSTGTVVNATGLQVYFPNSTMSYNSKYDSVADVRFAEQKEWGTFLKAFTKK